MREFTFRSIAIALLAGLIAQNTFADDKKSRYLSDWEDEGDYEGVKIECRQHVTKINQCRYTTTTDFNPITLLAVNIDASNLSKWMNNVTYAEQFDKKHDLDYKVYMTYHFPGARDRDSVTHSTVTFDDSDKSIQLNFRSTKHKDKPKDLKFVRFPAIKGHWKFTPTKNGKTDIEYMVIALPGEYVQKHLHMIYNFSNKEAGAKTIVNLLEMAKDPKYKQAKIDMRLAVAAPKN